ncbi:MAG: transcription termination factor Rho, partial [Psychrobacter glaciei]
MNLSELKKKSVPELLEIAEGMGMENVSRSRKQDLIF